MPAAPLPLMGLNLSAGNGIDARWRESISISAEKYRHAARQWVSLRRIWHSLRGYRASPSPNGKPDSPPRIWTGWWRFPMWLGVSLDFLLREPQQVSSPPSFAVADSPPFAEDGSPGASGVPRGIDSSLNGMAPAVAVERVASCGQVPVAPFGRETMAFWVSRNVPQHRFPGFRNVPPACRKRSLLNPPLPVSRRPLYALPVPMIPDFMVPIFGLSCAVPPRYAVSCCS